MSYTATYKVQKFCPTKLIRDWNEIEEHKLGTFVSEGDAILAAQNFARMLMSEDSKGTPRKNHLMTGIASSMKRRSDEPGTNGFILNWSVYQFGIRETV